MPVSHLFNILKDGYKLKIINTLLRRYNNTELSEDIVVFEKGVDSCVEYGNAQIKEVFNDPYDNKTIDVIVEE